MSKRPAAGAVRYVMMPRYVPPTITRTGQQRRGYTRLQRVALKPEEAGPVPAHGADVPGMDAQRRAAPMRRYNEALLMAAHIHAGQTRKGTENAHGLAVPYVTHPVAVSALVVRHGGDEDQAIAALLHDALEDGGPHWSTPILERFGPRVLALVDACTDAAPDASGRRPPWQERKRAYVAALAGKSDDARLVIACDKLHNLQCIVQDRVQVGDAVFDRFSASREQTLWYYGALVQALAPGAPPELAGELQTGLCALLQPGINAPARLQD